MLTLQEVCLQATRDSPGKEGLSCAWRPVQQHALGGLDANPQEKLRVFEGELDHLPELADLVVQPADAAEAHLPRVLERHVVHQRVDLARQHAHDGERRHVERHARSLFQLRLVDLGSAADNVAGA